MSTEDSDMICGGMVHSKTDLRNINIAKFAVNEYNKKNKKERLEFVKVVKVEYMMTYPVDYEVLLEAIDGNGHKKMYNAVVEEKANKDLPPYDTGAGWMASHQKQTLLEFNPVE